MDALVDYYSRRTAEYEQIWHRDDPVRQGEQAAIISAMREVFAGCRGRPYVGSPIAVVG